VTAADRLRALALALPAGGSATLSREALLDLAGDATASAAPGVGDVYTVVQVAERLSRAPSTIRGWLEAGLMPGAVKIRGRAWAVPAEALSAFLKDGRQGDGPRPSPRRGMKLDTWRKAL